MIKLAGIKNVFRSNQHIKYYFKTRSKSWNLAEEVKAFESNVKISFMIADDEHVANRCSYLCKQKLKGEQKNLENLLINYRSQPPVWIKHGIASLGA